MRLPYHHIFSNKGIVQGLFAVLCILAVVYSIILLSLVFSVIERKQDALSIRDLTSQFSVYEAKYANAVSAINDATLKERGFTRIDTTTFAVRKADIASYTVLYAR